MSCRHSFGAVARSTRLQRARRLVRAFAIVLAASPAATVVTAASTGAPAKNDAKGTNRASVITDKSCPVIVKPYALTDNVAEINGVLGRGALDQVGGMIAKVLKGEKASMGSGDLLATAKLTAKRSNWMPMQAEVAYGEKKHKLQDDIIERDSKGAAQRYAVADQILKRIVDAIGQSTNYEFKLYVVGNASRNAMALPGGYVYVDDGLISQEKYRPKAYFALAHEVAHVLRRHETQELQSRTLDSITTGSELIEMLKGLKTEPKSLLDHVTVEKKRFTQHHIDEELEADSCAARLLSRALPNDAALAESLRAFIADLAPVDELQATASSSGSNDVQQLASSVSQIVDTPTQRHPSNAAREANLRSMYAEITGTTPKASQPVRKKP